MAIKKETDEMKEMKVRHLIAKANAITEQFWGEYGIESLGRDLTKEELQNARSVLFSLMCIDYKKPFAVKAWEVLAEVVKFTKGSILCSECNQPIKRRADVAVGEDGTYRHVDCKIADDIQRLDFLNITKIAA